jgi:hypothetical protein
VFYGIWEYKPFPSISPCFIRLFLLQIKEAIAYGVARSLALSSVSSHLKGFFALFTFISSQIVSGLNRHNWPHRSVNRFSTGVPVNRTWYLARRLNTVCDFNRASYLMLWASSSTTVPMFLSWYSAPAFRPCLTRIKSYVVKYMVYDGFSKASKSFCFRIDVSLWLYTRLHCSFRSTIDRKCASTQ